jgi:HK97 family phage major capsid protein
MPFNNQITRSGAAALVPEEYSAEILSRLPTQSAALSLFRHVTMSRQQYRMPIIAALPVAYWVAGDTGLKQTTEQQWANKYLNAEELAVIVPIPEKVLDDAAFDIWAEVTPFVVEAIGRALDGAIFLGINKPASWPTAIATVATEKGNTGIAPTKTPQEGGIVGDISELMAKVEAGGFDVSGIIAHRKFKGLLRQARGTTGEQLTAMDPGTEVEPEPTNIFSVPISYPMRGVWPTTAKAIELILGDFSQGILGVRQDLTFKMLDQAVLHDETGKVIFNLAQQDMVAMRVVCRFGFEVANVPQPELSATQYPFGVLNSAT